MRVSKEKAAANREKILSEAARLFRERGLLGVGVDELAEAAGLSYGSLYSHFGSKEAMTAEAVRQASADFAARMQEKKTVGAYIAHYLSPEHRDNPGAGCSVATLATDMRGQSKAVRHAFTENVKRAIERIGARFMANNKKTREDEILAAISTLVGAMVMARGVDDAALSDRILAAAHKHLRADL
jgi:TetR/AcrR family transcriptional repressor of nem operon